jgi:hypothetical protein
MGRKGVGRALDTVANCSEEQCGAVKVEQCGCSLYVVYVRRLTAQHLRLCSDVIVTNITVTVAAAVFD